VLRLGALTLGLLAGALGCQQESAAPASRGAPPPAGPPAFVGRARCAGCHQKEDEAYRASDHARAMQVATAETVAGDFGGARFAHGEVTSTFSRRDGKFLVRTDGPDGKPGEFEIAYTFGIEPLQQYLVHFPGGRVQALGLAWDTRPKTRGGQRWLHLYAGERLVPPNPLHWTGREQTWNFQCAECHSTDLRKHYDLAQNRYATTWAEITVSCEACHGPGSAHVAWAEARPAGAPRAPAGATGLPVRLGRDEGSWTIKDPGRGIAEWTGPPRSTAEVDACARCHARRRPIVDPYPYGTPFLDTHVPALLDPRLYHADGQILGEVYEYGSFVQSRMFRAGVTCSDCHDPHGGKLRAAGNGVCARCHLPAKFDTPAHHRHKADAEGARCVGCHMASRTYMVVDARRDHSFRVPRPDLSVALGTPNACTGCHQDRPAKWAAERVAAWFGADNARRPHFAAALDSGRRGLPAAETALAALAMDAGQPGIARATALSLLTEYLTPASFPAVEAGLRDGDPLVRAAALAVVEALPSERRVALAAPLLRDPVRTVRIGAAHALAGTPAGTLPEDRRPALEQSLAELVRSEMVSADRPEAHLNLANLFARLGRAADAESELRTALWLDPRFVPALVNLADLFRAQGRDADDGERFLERALEIAPNHAEALHALGLLRARQGRRDEAVRLLERAAAARPDSVRLSYVYAVALRSTGDAPRAIAVLEHAHRRRPADREVLVALATFLRDRGDPKAALGYAEKLAALAPDDSQVRTLVEELRRWTGSP
jgi:tetratricopeptide (TPR) repeat protein